MLAPQAPRGVTLIEAAIALAIAAVIATSALPGLGSFIETRRLDAAATRVAADLRQARAEALLRGSGLWFSVQHADWGDCYVLHTGRAGQCRCEPTGPASCDGEAQALKTAQLPAADRFALQANVGAIRFDALHGTATPTATLKVVAASGRSILHVVNVMGRVRSCTPRVAAPAVPGWQAC